MAGNLSAVIRHRLDNSILVGGGRILGVVSEDLLGVVPSFVVDRLVVSWDDSTARSRSSRFIKLASSSEGIMESSLNKKMGLRKNVWERGFDEA